MHDANIAEAHRVNVLDHGFVILRNMSGPTRRSFNFDANGCRMPRDFDADDVDPANAARMSFHQTDSNRTRSQDLKLCSYLMKNRHTSPFEMVQVWLQMKLPIFIARQFVRHRTVRMNEVSGRYVVLPSDWYVPEVIGAKADDKKQGQVNTLSPEKQAKYRRKMHDHAAAGFELYMEMIDDGVAPEHARIVLGLGHYTEWLWNQDLHNLMHFLSLRDHSHAQLEAQAYARAIDALIRQVVPETMNLYDQFYKR